MNDSRRYIPTWRTIPMIMALTALACVLGTQFLLDWYSGPRLGGARVLLSVCALCGAAGAFGIGLLLSKAVIEPVKRLAANAGSEAEEVKSYGDALDAVTEFVDAHRLESYTLASLEAGVCTLSMDGIVTSFSPVAERLTGYVGAEVVGEHYSRVFEAASDARSLQDLIRVGLEQGRKCSSEDAVILTRDDREMTVGVTISLLRDSSGTALGLVVIFKDIEEVNRVRGQVRRSEELASLGGLTAGLAHEIRNPLGSLRGLTELIEEDLPPDSPKCSYTQRILGGLDHLNELVEDLLSFGQPCVANVCEMDPSELLAGAADFVGYEAGREVAEIRSEDSARPVKVDTERMSEALVNIFHNAFDAAGEDGSVDAGVRMVSESEEEWVELSIHNSGSYIPPERREEIFNPFATWKPHGTGLGLSICHQIVASHGGRIAVDSDSEKGTTFRILLPAVSPEEDTTRSFEYALQHSDC